MSGTYGRNSGQITQIKPVNDQTFLFSPKTIGLFRHLSSNHWMYMLVIKLTPWQQR